eukprot:4406063-Alexandrium_andersonii.AAC.1
MASTAAVAPEKRAPVAPRAVECRSPGTIPPARCTGRATKPPGLWSQGLRKLGLGIARGDG